MALQLRPFDPAEYLDDPEEMAAYLEDALSSGDSRVFADAVGVVARARGMSQLAKDTGLSRQALYRSLSADGHPEFATMMKVLNALGITLLPRPVAVSRQDSTAA